MVSERKGKGQGKGMGMGSHAGHTASSFMPLSYPSTLLTHPPLLSSPITSSPLLSSALLFTPLPSSPVHSSPLLSCSLISCSLISCSLLSPPLLCSSIASPLADAGVGGNRSVPPGQFLGWKSPGTQIWARLVRRCTTSLYCASYHAFTATAG